jgi:very-short-patch-repair endonuclease
LENHLYNKKLQPFAKHLRNNGTKAEACLWKYVLRAGRTQGYSFKRQRPVLEYIADFICEELHLIIEVDGITHLHERTVENDRKKDQALRNAGYTVLRFTNREVLMEISGVAKCIEQWINEHKTVISL